MIRGRNERVRVQTVPVGESMTKSAPGYEADVNVIIGRYVKTGDASVFNQRIGAYADVSEVGDYQSCVAKVKAAEAAFMTLPAKVREQFRNDPQELVDAMADPARRGELESAGIVVPPNLDSSVGGAAKSSATPQKESGTIADSST